MNADLRKRFKFFFENDGYCTPPGRAACALQSARVDALRECLEDEGRIFFQWQADDDPDCSWMDEKTLKEPHDVEGCTLYVDGKAQDDMWGIFDATSAYRRIVEKDLLHGFIDRNTTFPPSLLMSL